MASDFTDDDFLRKLRATFNIEAREHLQEISSLLLKLERGDSSVPGDLLNAVFRHFHSLKGAAGAVNMSQMEKLCQASEALLQQWRNGLIQPDPAMFDSFHAVLNLIEQGVPDTEGNVGLMKAADVDAVIAPLKMAVSRLIEENKVSMGEAKDLASHSSDDVASPSHGPVESDHNQEHRWTDAFSKMNNVRVPTEKLNYLLTQTEELITFKQGYHANSDILRRIAGSLQDWSREWNRVQALINLDDKEIVEADNIPDSEAGKGRYAGRQEQLNFLSWNVSYIKGLQERLGQLSATVSRDAQIADKLINDLLAVSKQLLMLPFSTITDMIPKLIRDLSRDQGKTIDLELSGADMEMDKRILEALKDPLMHLLRNSVDHGIESPGERERLNKSKRGTISITVSRADANRAEITVSDDGAGINLKQIMEIAREKGFIKPSESEALSIEDEIMLAFRPGLTTKAQVTKISGRGIGLAIVWQTIQDLGGKITVATTQGEGTSFKISIPLIFGTINGLLISSAKQLFIFPAAHVDRLIRTSVSELKLIHDRQWIILDDKAVPYVKLANLLGIYQDVTIPGSSDGLTLLLAFYGNERVAFGIDEVLSVQEVLVKNLRRPLLRIRNILSASTLESGQVVPILNVHDLVQEVRKGKSMVSEGKSDPERKGYKSKVGKRILLAEDSITSRMLLKGILETAGYAVVTAIDGMEALTHLRTEDFDLIVSDIEMPRMNGFDLTVAIRQDKRLAHKPVILITALSSREDRERGIEVGANAYIVKSSFEQSNLLDIVQRLA